MEGGDNGTHSTRNDNVGDLDALGDRRSDRSRRERPKLDVLPTRGFLLLLIGYLVLLGGNLFADQVTQEPGEQVQTDTPSERHMGEPPSPNQPQPVYPEGKPEGL